MMADSVVVNQNATSDTNHGNSMNASTKINKKWSQKLLQHELLDFTVGKTGIFLTFVTIALHLVNLYTDYALGVTYIRQGDYKWGVITLGLVVVPSLIISLFTFILHRKSNGVFLMTVSVPKCIVYPLCGVLHGHLARSVMWLTLLMNKVPLIGVKKAIWVFRDITSMTETFTHALPQLFLQFYIIVFEQGTYSTLQLVCLLSSWVSAGWDLQSQFHGFKWKLVAFEVNLLCFASRAAAVDMLASVNKAAPFVVLVAHFLCVLPLWFRQNGFKLFRKKSGTNRFELLITDAFYAATYAGSNTVTPIICKHQFCLALILFLENIAMIILGILFGQIDRKPEHFMNHSVDYSTSVVQRTCNVTTLKYEGNYRLCTVPFATWRQADFIMKLACAITCMAFMQVFIITSLRKCKRIEETSLVSRLGSSEFKLQVDGRVEVSQNPGLQKTSSPHKQLEISSVKSTRHLFLTIV